MPANPNIERLVLLTCARQHFVITPADVDLDVIPRAIRVGGDGNLSMTDAMGTTIVYAVTAGEVVNFAPVRVNAATTATGLVGWL